MPNKAQPSAEWIASLRRRFEVEREIDWVLTRKLERRAGPGYSPVPLPTLVGGVESLLKAELDSPFAVRKARWLSGGASKLQMAFELEWEEPGKGKSLTPMVLRMEPAESIVETSRRREFQLIRAFEGVVPVPRAYWCDAEGQHFPHPALIYGFAEGVAKPSDTTAGVSGTGTRLTPEWRAKLAPQFVDYLAKIHNFDYRAADLGAFDVPEANSTQCALWSINWWERVWEEDSDEDSALVRVAAAWLRKNLPVLDRPCVVHADYRIGNFLFTEPEGRISAWLDWELGRIGDRHQDLAWSTSGAFGHFAEDGKTFLTCGLMPEAEFLDQYQKVSGLNVDPRAMHWYKVYNNFTMVVMMFATCYRIARGGKSHQDVLLTWLMGIGPMIAEEMRQQIENAP